MTPLGAHIWISSSPDLRHWGNHKLMLEARRGAWWDANKIGMSPPPIETPRGWLMIYHGVRRTPSSSIYRLGDLQQPEKCLIRGDSWIFAPETEYEHHRDGRGVPVRVHDRIRRRYDQSLLRGSRLQHRFSARQRPIASHVARRQRSFRRAERSPSPIV
jgi:hypothetical protein